MAAFLRITILTLALGIAFPARAAEVETALMTSLEIGEAVAAGKTTIIIPTGGTEQNGPHMITGKHNFIVAETARRIAAKLGDALVAPVMAYVPEGDIAKREGNMAYPGSISVPPEVYAQVLEATASSFAIHGFKTIVFLGDSGPNQAPQKAVASVLSAQWAKDGVRVLSAETYYAAPGANEYLKTEGETDATIGQHASIRDTSELMAVFPAGVKLEKAVADKDGVIGDPSRASAARGEKLLTFKVDAAVKEIQAARLAPLPAAAPEPGIFDRIWRAIFG